MPYTYSFGGNHRRCLLKWDVVIIHTIMHVTNAMEQGCDCVQPRLLLQCSPAV
jgi:hypothetical protein